MNAKDYKFVVREGGYFRKMGKSFTQQRRIIIGLENLKDDIIYPHPISNYLNECYFNKSKAINTQRKAANVIVQFLNFIHDNVESNNVDFINIKGMIDLKKEHAELYLKHCVEELCNDDCTLDSKEVYLSSFYYFLYNSKILNEKLTFKTMTYSYKSITATKEVIEFLYCRSDNTYDRKKVKRKDLVPRYQESALDRKIIRLNNIREFLLVALEIVPNIAFGVALQFYAGLRVGGVVNLVRRAIICQNGYTYGQGGMIIEVRDRQQELFSRNTQTTGEQIKSERDQSVLIDPVLSYIYENHVTKVLTKNNKTSCQDALFLDSNGNAMSKKTYCDHFSKLKTYYLGLLRQTNGRYQDYRDFAETKWSTHIGRGAFTNMCLDVGFSATQTAILRGDKSTQAMEDYKDLISASFNISKALGLLEPQNAKGLVGMDMSIYNKYWKGAKQYAKKNSD